MAKAFNPDQQDFVSSMGRSFKGLDPQNLFSGPALLVASLLILIMVGAAAAYYRHFLWTQYIYWSRRLSGQAVTRDRRRISLEVVARQPSTQQAIGQGYTIDLSPHGMYLRMSPALEPRERFQFTLFLPKGLIRGEAQVVWEQKQWSAFRPTGAGCRFTMITPDDERKLHELLRKGA